MKVAILGTGAVGQALANGFSRHGHQVALGTRDPGSGKLSEFLGQHPDIQLTTHEEAATWADIAVLCTAWAGAQATLELAGAEALAGKVLIDVTNPLGPGPNGSSGPPSLVLGHTDSAGEQVQRWVPGAKVVKCWNIVGNAHMIDPDFPDGPPTMFIAGNHEQAKATVQDLLDSFGWDCSDLGGIESSRYLEPLAMVWILDFFATGSGNMALRMLRK